MFEGAGHFQAGGAAVEDDGLAVGDEVRDLGGDALLEGESVLRAEREGGSSPRRRRVRAPPR